MMANRLLRLISGLIAIGLFGTHSLSQDNSQTYDQTRKLLLEMTSVRSDREQLAKLFAFGDNRIADLTRALDDSDSEISLRAQIVIRYLGNEQGMKALRDWYARRRQYSISGSVPLPLSEWDYNFIDNHFLTKSPSEWRFLALEYILPSPLINLQKLGPYWTRWYSLQEDLVKQHMLVVQ